MEQEHNFDGDPDGSIGDAEDHIGRDGAAVREVGGHSDGKVDQEQN